MEHTPEPWGIAEGDSTPVVFSNATGDDVAYIISGREEDARLIATAPRLYAALNAVLRECALVHKIWGEGCNIGEANAAEQAAWDAIAAVEGRERSRT